MSFDPAFFLVFPVFVLSIVVHECAHGVMALWCGDPTARDRGRLTLNPLSHIDPLGSLLIPGVLAIVHSPFLFGWAKPVPIDWARLKSPRNDPVKVALAGPLSNALLALGFAALARLAPVKSISSALRTAGMARSRRLAQMQALCQRAKASSPVRAVRRWRGNCTSGQWAR